MKVVAGTEVAVVDRPTGAVLNDALSGEGEAGSHLLGGDGEIAKGFREPDLHHVVVVDDVAVVGRKTGEDAFGAAAGIDVAGKLRDVGCLWREAHVAG